MADVKWIKITTDIFDDEKMYAIETMQDGYLIELIWFKLLCLAGKCNNHGFLMISDKIAYTDEILAKIFRMEIGSVQRAIALFQKLGMVEVVNDAYMISNWDIHQNERGLEDLRKSHAEAQKRYREKQKVSAIEKKSDVTVTSRSDIISSYSISNIYYSLLNVKEYEYINNNSLLNSSILEWLKYKETRPKKEWYKEQGLKTLLTRIIGYDKEYGTGKVNAVIEDSISNQYQGICWDKIDKIKVFKKEPVIVSQTESPKKKSRFDGWDEEIVRQMREQGAILEDEGIDYTFLTESQIQYIGSKEN